MRKLAIIAGVVFALAAAAVALVHHPPDDRASWPLSEDPVCASVMAARPPDIVLATDDFDRHAISSSPPWDALGRAPLPSLRMAGYLHREFGGLVLYRSYDEVVPATILPSPPIDRVTKLWLAHSVISTWAGAVPLIDGRCVVVDGAFSGWSVTDVRRVSAWVEPHRHVVVSSLFGGVQ
jgi:hypothetical protein